MQEKYKYIIIPQDKSGWEIGEVLRSHSRYKAEDHEIGALYIAQNKQDKHATIWQAQTVLVVDTEAEIKDANDILTDDRNNRHEKPIYAIEKCICVENGWIYGSINGKDIGHNPDWTNKIIGAYPSIDNIPTLSPSFLQQVVDDANSGGSGSVVVENDNHAQGLPLSGHKLMDKMIKQFIPKLNPDGSLCCRVEKKEKPMILGPYTSVTQVPKSTPSNVEEMAKGGMESRKYAAKETSERTFSSRIERLAYCAGSERGYTAGYLAGNKDKDMEAINFAEWLHNNQFVRFLGEVPYGENKGVQAHNNHIWFSSKIHYGSGSEYYATSQLYTIYKEQRV